MRLALALETPMCVNLLVVALIVAAVLPNTRRNISFALPSFEDTGEAINE